MEKMPPAHGTCLYCQIGLESFLCLVPLSEPANLAVHNYGPVEGFSAVLHFVDNLDLWGKMFVIF